jgi:hypothetical protein
MSSLGSADQTGTTEATGTRILRYLEARRDSPEAFREAALVLQEQGEKVIAEAKADAARLLRETAAIAERLTDESRAAAAQVEREIAKQWEQIVYEREKLDREIAEWRATVATQPTSNGHDEDLLRRISEERVLLARERELFERKVADWEAAVAQQRDATASGAGHDPALTANGQGVADLKRAEEQALQRLSEHRHQLVSMLQTALSELEPLDLSGSESGAGDLSSTLTTRARNA